MSTHIRELTARTKGDLFRALSDLLPQLPQSSVAVVLTSRICIKETGLKAPLVINLTKCKIQAFNWGCYVIIKLVFKNHFEEKKGVKEAFLCGYSLVRNAGFHCLRL